MTTEIVTVPCLSDNYAFLVRVGDKTALVDAPEAGPIHAALEERGWGLNEIWITHHHDDHVQAVDELKSRYGCKVRGSSEDGKIPVAIDMPFAPGDTFTFEGQDVHVIPVPGHTLGHIAFYMPGASALFSADSLMALGCGRVFEGTMEQMWQSLSRLMELPSDTTVYSGHEYTANNAKFALTIEPDNPMLADRAASVQIAASNGIPTVPSLMTDELQTNPFLRAGLQSVKDGLSMSDASDAEVFAEIRRRKDAF